MLSSRDKKKLLKNVNEIISSSDEVLNTFKKGRLVIVRYSQVDEVFNFFHFLITYIQDIGVSMGLYLKCDDRLSKNLQGRLIAVICFQFIDEYSKLKGKNIRKSFHHLNDSGEYFENELNLFDKRLKVYRKKYENYFKEIRNNSIAHRDVEVNEYYKFMESFNPDEIFFRAGKLIMVFAKINIMSAAFINALKEKSE